MTPEQEQMLREVHAALLGPAKYNPKLTRIELLEKALILAKKDEAGEVTYVEHLHDVTGQLARIEKRLDELERNE